MSKLLTEIRDWGLIVLCFAIIIGAVLWALLSPYFEAKSFNDCTGGNANYFTALTTELRIERCDL